jgi:hypothetical protein
VYWFHLAQDKIQLPGSCGHGNEPSECIKDDEFIDQLSDYKLIKNLYDWRFSQRWLRRVSSSGIWRCVVRWVSTDVSEDHISSIFRVEEISSAETFILPWRWMRYVPPKRRLKLNGLHDVISQSTVLFITTAVKTSDPTYQDVCSMEIERLVTTIMINAHKVHPFYEPGYVITCVGNITEEKSYLSSFEFENII